MRRLLLACLLAACATVPESDYVPGGADLPPEAKARYREAIRLKNAGETDAALKELGALSHAYPLRLGIQLYYLRLARQQKGVEYAVSLYRPPPPGVDTERAAFLVRLASLPEEEVAERRGLLEAATAQEPGEPFWRLGLADVQLTGHAMITERAEHERDLGRVQTSAESFEEAKRVLESARQEAETALQYDPAFKEAHVLLGYIWTQTSEFATEIDQRDEGRNVAMYHYLEAKKLDPQCVVTRLNLAENLLWFGRYGEAARELRVAVRLAPKEARAWNNLGVTYYATGRLDLAVKAYRKALAIEPKNARIRTALADCLRRHRLDEEAVAELEQARRDAEDDRALQATIAFKLAAIHEHERNYEGAVEEYQRHIDLGGSDSAKARSRIRLIYEK